MEARRGAAEAAPRAPEPDQPFGLPVGLPGVGAGVADGFGAFGAGEAGFGAGAAGLGGF